MTANAPAENGRIFINELSFANTPAISEILTKYTLKFDYAY